MKACDLPRRCRALGALLSLSLLMPSFAGAAEVEPEALEALPPADVVVLGEVHDNALHHLHQARAVAALQPRALVFEMLTPEQVAGIGDVDRRDRQAMEVALGWEDSGWPDFAIYWPVFAAAPGAQIFGAGIDRSAARAAMQDGAAAYFGADAGAYGLDAPLSPELQARLEAEQMQAHCNAMPKGMMPGMVAVQRLRDAALARAAVEAMAATGGPVVVIAGSGHARADLGVPALLARAAPGLRVLSVGQIEATAQDATDQDLPFDLWIRTPLVSREDPCLSLTGG